MGSLGELGGGLRVKVLYRQLSLPYFIVYLLSKSVHVEWVQHMLMGVKVLLFDYQSRTGLED